jgi:hypothetical protein
MYNFKFITFLLLLLSSQGHTSPATNPSPNKRQTTSKYCSPTSSICYLEYSTSASNPTYRIAIPDATTAPFDTLLQITAPVALGWAGFAWGGGMTGNPLTVTWPNGNNATVSSRWSTYSPPFPQASMFSPSLPQFQHRPY